MATSNRDIGIMMIAPAPIWYAISYVFARRQHLHPISGRYPQVSLIGGVGLGSLLILEGLGNILDEYGYPCYFRLLSFQWLAPTCFFILALRMVTLLANFDITRHLFNNHGGVNGVPNNATIAPAPAVAAATTGIGLNPGVQPTFGAAGLNMDRLPFFVRHRRIIRPEWSRRAALIASATFLVIWTLSCLIFAPTRAFSWSCSAIQDAGAHAAWYNITSVLPFLFVGSMLTACCVAGAKLSRFDQDGYGIKKELKLFVAGVGGLTFVQVILVLNKANWKWIDEWSTPIILWLGNFALFLPTMLYPVYLSYAFAASQRRQALHMQQLTKLTDWLDIPNGFEIFLKFCMMEFCSESLYFYRQSCEFKAMVVESSKILHRLIMSSAPTALTTGAYQLEQHVAQAITMLETYIDPRSPYELNLSSEVRRRARRMVIAIEKHVVCGVNPTTGPTTTTVDTPTNATTTTTTVVAGKYQVVVSSDDVLLSGDALLSGVAGDIAKYYQLLIKLATVFDETAAACVHLLQGNSFTRFRASALYRDFVSELEKGNTAKVAMKRAGSRLRLSIMSQGGGGGNHDDLSIVSGNHNNGSGTRAAAGGGAVHVASVGGNPNNGGHGSQSGVLALGTPMHAALLGATSPPPPPLPLITIPSLSPTAGGATLSKRASGAFAMGIIAPPTSTGSTASGGSPTAASARVPSPMIGLGIGGGTGNGANGSSSAASGSSPTMGISTLGAMTAAANNNNTTTASGSSPTVTGMTTPLMTPLPGSSPPSISPGGMRPSLMKARSRPTSHVPPGLPGVVDATHDDA